MANISHKFILCAAPEDWLREPMNFTDSLTAQFM
jgi:hypothetical protein